MIEPTKPQSIRKKGPKHQSTPKDLHGRRPVRVSSKKDKNVNHSNNDGYCNESTIYEAPDPFKPSDKILHSARKGGPGTNKKNLMKNFMRKHFNSYTEKGRC